MFKIVFHSSLFLLMPSCQKDNQILEAEKIMYAVKTTGCASNKKEIVEPEKI